MRGIILFIFAQFFLLSASIFAQGDPFPSEADLPSAKAGELVVRQGAYQGLKADWCMLAVPENRDKSGGKLLRLPVLRIYAKNKSEMARSTFPVRW